MEVTFNRSEMGSVNYSRFSQLQVAETQLKLVGGVCVGGWGRGGGKQFIGSCV